MPLIIWQAWSWLSFLGGGLIKKIPWQVWVGIAGVIAVLYYGHVREQRGYERCQAQVKEATDREVARQTQVSADAVKASKLREAQALATAEKASEDLKDVQDEIARLKKGDTVCLPKSVTDKYRRK